jgi:hypothetical protein
VAVQIRLMGQNHDEVAAVMAALVAGEPVTVMADGSLAPNHRDGGARAFGMAELPGYAPPAGTSTERPAQRAHAERLDRRRRGITR